MDIYLFGCGCGDLERREFGDWLFGRGFDVEFGACFIKACFLVGLNGAHGARGARRERVRAPGKKPV